MLKKICVGLSMVGLVLSLALSGMLSGLEYSPGQGLQPLFDKTILISMFVLMFDLLVDASEGLREAVLRAVDRVMGVTLMLAMITASSWAMQQGELIFTLAAVATLVVAGIGFIIALNTVRAELQDVGGGGGGGRSPLAVG